jgi:hypothetical protein
MFGSMKFKEKPFPELQPLIKKSPNAFKNAQKKGAIQFLNWANNGSAKETRKPPIRWGVLRGSSSAFVGSELVQTYDIPIMAGADERPTPAQSHNAKDDQMTWVWNTDYATKMHETNYKPGPFTAQDGNAGPKWLEKHLNADKDDLMKVIGMEYKKETGL